MPFMSDPVGHSAVPLPGLNPVLSGKVKTVQVLAAEPTRFMCERPDVLPGCAYWISWTFMTSSFQFLWFSMSCSRPCSSAIVNRLSAGVLLVA